MGIKLILPTLLYSGFVYIFINDDFYYWYDPKNEYECHLYYFANNQIIIPISSSYDTAILNRILK